MVRNVQVCTALRHHGYSRHMALVPRDGLCDPRPLILSVPGTGHWRLHLDLPSDEAPCE